MAKTLSMGPSRLWYDTVDPGLSETNIDLFNWWLNTSSGKFWICLDNTVGAQAWEQCVVQGANISAGNLTLASGASLQTSTGNGNTALLKAYNTGSLAYDTFGTLTAGSSPSLTLAPTSITFAGETAFNHYFEQQSWTPTIIGSTTAGVGTYTLQAGYYTRIGNMIFAACEITWTNHTGTGDLWVGNLPFTVRNSANYSPEGIINTQNMTLPGGANRTSIGSAVANTTHLIVVVPVSGGANSPIQMQVSGNIHATIAYLT